VWQNEFLSRKEFTQLGYHLLSDYREATFQLPPAFIPELINFMKSIRHIVEGKKQSIIVEDPQSTAASLVFENQVNAEVGFRVKIFSTPQAALQWLIH
jgi:aminoglycoside phosphotransferase family enzyme